MKILVATDGTLDTESAADTLERAYRDGDEVTVFTAVSFPREFLQRLGEVAAVKEVAELAHEAGPGMLGFASGAKVAERMATARDHEETVGNSPVAAVIETVGQQRTGPLTDALAARNIKATAAWWPTEGRTATTILDAAKDLGCGLIVIGSHGHGRFEGLLGSTGTKIVRHAKANVLIIRNGN